MMNRFVSSALVVALVAACGGSTYSVGSDSSSDELGKGKGSSSGNTGSSSSSGGAMDAGSPGCSNDGDCPTGFQCGFPTADACNAKGTCFDTHDLAVCAAFSPGCACDGTDINVICNPFPSGYVSKPLAHTGSCNEAQDGGAAPCFDDSQCDSGWQCVYPKADACTAKGVCKDARGLATCAAYSPGCACDGSTINVICQPFDGYVSKPLAHPGACP